MKRYIFFKVGKARNVFEALRKGAILEKKFGRLIEPLEPVDFSKN